MFEIVIIIHQHNMGTRHNNDHKCHCGHGDSHCRVATVTPNDVGKLAEYVSKMSKYHSNENPTALIIEDETEDIFNGDRIVENYWRQKPG